MFCTKFSTHSKTSYTPCIISLDSNVDEFGHKVLTYFADAEGSPIGDSSSMDATKESLNYWIRELFIVIVDLGTTSSQPTHFSSVFRDENSYGFVSLSLSQLRDIVNTLTLSSKASEGQRLHLTIGVPLSICQESWLSKNSWRMLKKGDVPPNSLPASFADHPVLAL